MSSLNRLASNTRSSNRAPVVRPLIIWGSAGCGKSTVAQRVAAQLGQGCVYLDADDFHSQASIDKMRRGLPLTSEDRQPWLERLNQYLHSNQRAGLRTVLACSALREAYRKTLGRGLAPQWYHLQIEEKVARRRVQQRPQHFFSEAVLQSQFMILEAADYGLKLDAQQGLDVITDLITRDIEALADTPASDKKMRGEDYESDQSTLD